MCIHNINIYIYVCIIICIYNIIIFQDMNRSIGISRVRPCIAECWWFSMFLRVEGLKVGVQYQRQWKVTRRTIQGFDMPGRWQRPLRKVLVSSRFSRCPKFLDHVAPTCFLPMIFHDVSKNHPPHFPHATWLGLLLARADCSQLLRCEALGEWHEEELPKAIGKLRWWFLKCQSEVVGQ